MAKSWKNCQKCEYCGVECQYHLGIRQALAIVEEAQRMHGIVSMRLDGSFLCICGKEGNGYDIQDHIVEEFRNEIRAKLVQPPKGDEK